MKFEKLESIQNYAATVIKLPPKQKVEGLDSLVNVEVFGNNVLIQKDSDPNQLYIFFIAGSKINHDFLKNNNLYRDKNLNLDNTKGGFFDDSGRVKALRLRGVISTGFVIPVTHLSYLKGFKESYFSQGQEFNSIDGVIISDKYVVKQVNQPSTKSDKSRPEKKIEVFDRIIPNQFRFHTSTNHFAKNLLQFDINDLIVITEKYHGTSAVFANVLTRRKLNFFERILVKLGFKILDREYDILYSSRTVLKNKNINKNQNSFYDSDVWGFWYNRLMEQNKIEQGITLYGEIVGYLPNGKQIQKDYTYGQQNGSSEFLVYRITYTKPDGSVIEFSWRQIINYCNKYSLKYVDQLYYGFVKDVAESTFDGVNFQSWEDAFFNGVRNKFAYEQDCKYNPKMPAEGVVIRNENTFSAFKLKNRRFVEKESQAADKEEVNIEDNA